MTHSGKIKLFVVLFLLIPSMYAHADKFEGVRSLIFRRIPQFTNRVEFVEKDSENGYADSYTYYTKGSRLVVEATSSSAASAALGAYLNDYCHASFSHCGDNLPELEGALPEVSQPQIRNCRFRYRYALNYCTYNYTYSFYKWEDWEKELDWMALQGVNLMLAPVGNEIVWANVLREYGFSDSEIQDYVAGPGYTAWWLMGNLEGWGGPMSLDMMEARAELQRKMLARMGDLGIEPVLQGFCGMVPSTLASKYPDAKIVDQGMWGKVFQRPSVLLPKDELFPQMAESWYKEIKRQYGENAKYFGGDLFHEGGDTTGVGVTTTARLIEGAMQKGIKDAVWVLQGWSGNPKKELLDGLDARHTLVIDLFGESGTTWRDTHEFYGKPWIWATVNHFGGKTDTGGQLPIIIKGPHQAAGLSSGLLCGIGILPEGINSNPVVYDWALKTAWEEEEPSVDEYIKRYLTYRYGKYNEDLYRSWKILTNSIYGDFEIKGEGTFESIFCARPGKNVTSVSTWGPKHFQYSPKDVEDALILFRKAADEFKGSDTYEYDLVDIARQVLANYARAEYNRSMALYRHGDSEGFAIMGKEFLDLLRLQADLVGTRREFLVGTWLDKASKYGDSDQERALSEKNARMQISYWGPESATTRIRDYANKEWSGLLEDYYLPRWEAFYKYMSEDMAGVATAEPDYFAIEKAWVYNGRKYPTSPNGRNIFSLVDKVISVVRPAYKNSALSVEQRTEDLLSRMTLAEKIAQMRHIHFGKYDNEGKVDLEKLCSFTGGLSMGCIEAFPYSSRQYYDAMRVVSEYMKNETRLGIPVIPVMEGLHGVVQDGCTVYPQAIAQAATFTPTLVEEMASCIADEMTAIGAKQVLAPDLDIARELRWGRVEETYGEDPYLISCMGNAYVRGMQAKNKIVTLKHFMAHSAPTGGLNLASVKGGERELRDLYLLPFKSVIQHNAPLSIMNCYSSYDGMPVTSSRYYMTDLLRGELGFKGYVYSDWGSVTMLRKFHKVASDARESSRMAVEAGIDLEAGSQEYQNLMDNVQSGKLDVKYIDDAVRNILYAKFQSGLFEENLADSTLMASMINTDRARALSRRIADESTVLLLNKDGFLPLDKNKLRNIAVIGPNADKVQPGDYSWGADKSFNVTPYEGIKSYLTGSGVKVHYSEGCDLFSQNKDGIKAAVKVAKSSDVAIVFVGSQSAMLARASEPATAGEGYDLSDLKLPGVQMELIRSIAATGKPMVVVMVVGKPFETEEISVMSRALLVQWYAGQEAGNSIASILFGDVNPSGKTPLSFPKSVGHLPCYYSYLPTDKGYYNKKGTIDAPGRDYVFSNPYAVYPFGHGLSYTSFEYSDLNMDESLVSRTDTVKFNFIVKNTGSRRGMETAQVYVRDVVSSVVTPVKQLKAFEKVDLEAGESKLVSLAIPVSELSLHNANMEEVVEDGDFELYVGSSSEDIRLSMCFAVGTKTTVTVDSPTVDSTLLGEKIQIKGIVRNVQAAVLSDVKVCPASDESAAVITDRNGRFIVEVRLHDRLNFSLDGYLETSLEVESSKPIEIDIDPKIK